MDYQAMRTVPLFIINLPRVCYNLQAHEGIVWCKWNSGVWEEELRNF